MINHSFSWQGLKKGAAENTIETTASATTTTVRTAIVKHLGTYCMYKGVRQQWHIAWYQPGKTILRTY